MFTEKQLESTFTEVFQNKRKRLLDVYYYILLWNYLNLIMVLKPLRQSIMRKQKK